MKIHIICFSMQLPVRVVGVLFICVLMIMSGMGWGWPQSHMRHSRNNVKLITTPYSVIQKQKADNFHTTSFVTKKIINIE